MGDKETGRQEYDGKSQNAEIPLPVTTGSSDTSDEASGTYSTTDPYSSPANQPPPPGWAAFISAIDSIRRFYRLLRSKPPAFWQAFFAFCLVVNAAVTIYFLSGNLTNSTKATAIAKDALESVQRAFVVAGDPAWQGSLDDSRYVLRWTNDGGTRTRGARYRMNIKLTSTPLLDTFRFVDETRNPIENILLGPRASDASTSTERVTAKMMDDVKNGQHMYVWGWLAYNDVFRDTPEHITMACFEVIVSGDPLQQGRGGMTTLTRNKKCKTHNCADEECDGEPYGDSLIWKTVKTKR